MYAWEQHILQPLLLDLSILLKTQPYQDNLANTIDYAKLCTEITNLVSSKSYALIETVAEDVVQFIKNSYSNITTIKISVSKPKAVKNATNITFTLER